MLNREQRVQLFMSLFRGREDVFARRWEKWDKSVAGYAPAYADGSKETFQPLSHDWIEKHLLGSSTLGVYPLLQDNTCWFVAADFDDGGWKKSVKKFVDICAKHAIPIAIERSRSGNGAHAWCFFTQPYSTQKARRIFLHLLREANIIGEFDRNESFDRLFPSQDFLSGKGMGNLIALPLQGVPRRNGNSLFVDPTRDFQTFDDQWEFLASVTKMSPQTLDDLYAKFSGTSEISTPPTKRPSKDKQTKKNAMVLTINSMISIHRSVLPPALVSYVREQLNILNVERLVKEMAGLPTFGAPKYIKTLVVDDDVLRIPRGFLAPLREWLKEKKMPFGFIDERPQLDQIAFNHRIALRGYQQQAIDACAHENEGVIVAPAASGKTLMGLALIAQKRQPAIILTHRRQIYEQWCEQIESSLGIPKAKIGQVCSAKKQALSPITVAMVQTLSRMKDWGGIENMFGTVIVDECHHVPARMFRDVISRFNTRYLFGLTATPERKYNDGSLIAVYLGPVIHTIEKGEVETMRDEAGDNSISTGHTVTVRASEMKVPFGESLRHFPLLAKAISNDVARNTLIAHDIATVAREGKKCLVLSERKEHVDMLHAYLRKEFETIAFSGDLSARARELALQKIRGGRFQVLIATGQILGEGVDIAGLDALFLAFPVSFHGKLAQYIGRIRRDGGTKIIYDYRDPHIPLLEKMWKKRIAYYRKEEFVIRESIDGENFQSLTAP